MSEDKFKILLRWNGNGFDSVGQRSEGVYLGLQDEQQQWIFSYSDGTPLITRRTALRRANEIAKVGFMNPATGERVGINCKCLEDKDPYHGLPSILTSDEHEYNKNK